MTTELDRKALIKVVRHLPQNKPHKSFYTPYWNDDLQNAQNNKAVAERAWIQKNGPKKKQLKSEYCQKRKIFNRMLRRKKWHYQKQQMIELQTMYEHNKADFWRNK
jgi:hypothetical protein